MHHPQSLAFAASFQTHILNSSNVNVLPSANNVIVARPAALVARKGTSARGVWLRQKSCQEILVVALVVLKKRVSPESL
jgi:hypothetical protein